MLNSGGISVPVPAVLLLRSWWLVFFGMCTWYAAIIQHESIRCLALWLSMVIYGWESQSPRNRWPSCLSPAETVTKFQMSKEEKATTVDIHKSLRNNLLTWFQSTHASYTYHIYMCIYVYIILYICVCICIYIHMLYIQLYMHMLAFVYCGECPASCNPLNWTQIERVFIKIENLRT